MLCLLYTSVISNKLISSVPKARDGIAVRLLVIPNLLAVSVSYTHLDVYKRQVILCDLL